MPPEPTRTPPPTGAGPPVGEQRQRALADWVMGGGGGGLPPVASEAARGSAAALQPPSQPSHSPTPSEPPSKASDASVEPEPSAAGGVARGVAERRRALAEFSLTPRQMKAELDKVVIAQACGHRPNPGPGPDPDPHPHPHPHRYPNPDPMPCPCNPTPLQLYVRSGRGEARTVGRAVQPLPLRAALRPHTRARREGSHRGPKPQAGRTNPQAVPRQ